MSLACGFWAAGVLAIGEATALGGLQVDHSRDVEPGNVSAKPVFSWKMISDREGARQVKYRLSVSEANGREVWNSGEVASDRSTAVEYGWPELKPASRYRWSVAVQDETGAWCKPTSGNFTTGTLTGDFWNGSEWIRSNVENSGERTVAFARRFKSSKKIREAFWSITSGGIFEAYVNGRRVGESDMLRPGFTQVGRRRLAFTYDVTKLLTVSAGAENVLSAEVSSGWWSDGLGRTSADSAPGACLLRAVLTMRYDDMTEERIVTDENWQAALAGPTITAGIYEGVVYDAKQEDVGTINVGGAWPKAIVERRKDKISDFVGAPTRLRRDLELKPIVGYVTKGVEGASEAAFGVAKKVRQADAEGGAELNPGEMLVVDFGQNCAAVPEVDFEGEAGTQVVMRFAEMLNDGGGLKSRGNDGPEGTPYLTNLRNSFAGIKYKFAGKGVERYLTRNSFFGYRYMQFVADRPIRIHRVRSVPITSVPQGWDAGRLTTGNARVNRLFQNAKWGMYSNYLSIPTDCPQRDERAGWTGDTQAFAPAGMYLADVCGFLTKWMGDVRDGQRSDGLYPHVIPGYWYPGTTQGWTDAGIIVPWQLWRAYGDARTIRDNWQSMVEYFDYLERANGQYSFPAYGDWLSYEAGADAPWLTPERLTHSLPLKEILGDAFRCRNAEMLRDMALATGRAKDAECYGGIARKIREGFAKRSLDGEGRLKADRRNQCGALYALGYGLVMDESARKAVRKDLLDNIHACGDRLQTGFIGTAILLNTLTFAADAHEVACTLLLQDKNPSWLYSVDQGATTIWERWNSYTKEKGFGPASMNSFNHYAYGACAEWMFSALAGIRAEEPGYRRIRLEPLPDKRLAPFSATFDSPYGEIASSWKLEGETWRFEFKVPPNTTATIRLIDGRTFEKPAGRYEFCVNNKEESK